MTTIEITFEEYEIYKISLKNDVIYSTECVDFYSYFMKYENKINTITIKYSSLVLSSIKLTK